ncbi:putative binding-protein-dependent transport protein (periplasmic) [Candidatus Rhodobacter oscarellae]|uniref:Putative binding-protein-dependent transport protein (Periplasmic) n=1 Tax=Candidatus Rhodobacter oscarellae TaxID=1675527 RepID=A0A0J9E6S2_9RHOB|nr:ABC transporter substrate-binding protein [Candidatus Rhodobacter lobularis]KMW58392.1 putative binding-protein-dependent transport protein (periplasmic) [Candidatus Rhodobacter lobularis]
MKIRNLTLAATLLATTAVSVSAETLRWARQGDSLTLDPHAQNEGPTSALAHQIMETLVVRDMTGAMVPGLATEWGPSEENPNVWVFTLREGVTYHDGSTFDSEDAVFSIERAMTPDSGYKELLASVVAVRATGPYEVEIETNGPNPIMANNLTNLFMMDKGWAEANNTVKVQDYEGGEQTYASSNAMGTGPYKLVSREPDVKTVLTINENYWGMDEFPMEVTEIIYTPIQNKATRVAALLSGEVDFIQDVPVQDLARVSDAEGLEVRTAPQNRVIFFGLNQGDADLSNDSVDGTNPLADLRVRKAMSMAINRDAIKQVVMRGQSAPAGMIAPPFVNGWNDAMDSSSNTDLEQAKALMTEAGYADGFSITLDCPNDRYINDEAICQAAVGMLAQIGITVNLDAKPKAQHFPLIGNLETDFYMLGWGVPTYDSEYIFNFLVHSKGEKYGSWNATRFSNPDLDVKIQALAAETDLPKRDAMINDIWKVVQDEQLYIPIHHQVLNWGMKSKVNTIVDPGDAAQFKYFTFN